VLDKASTPHGGNTPSRPTPEEDCRNGSQATGVPVVMAHWRWSDRRRRFGLHPAYREIASAGSREMPLRGRKRGWQHPAFTRDVVYVRNCLHGRSSWQISSWARQDRASAHLIVGREALHSAPRSYPPEPLQPWQGEIVGARGPPEALRLSISSTTPPPPSLKRRSSRSDRPAAESYRRRPSHL
jgi:hypothetical protein